MEDILTLEGLLNEQAADSGFQDAAQTFGHPASGYLYDLDRIFVRKAPIDGALQKVVPATSLARISYLLHYSALTGHPQE